MELKNLPPDQILSSLSTTLARLEQLVPLLTDEILTMTKPAGSWTVKEILGHLHDTQKVWGQRIECVCRQDSPVLEPYDPEANLVEERYKTRDVAEFFSDFIRLRRQTLHLLRGHSDLWERVGVHPELGPLRTKDLAETLALHEQHHLAQIEAVYRDWESR